MSTTTDTDKRTQALTLLAQLTGLEDVRRIIQRGTNVDEARFTLEFTDGRALHLGAFATLASQAKLGAALAVGLGYYPPSVPAADWRALVAILVAHAVDVQDSTGETTLDDYRGWVSHYVAERAVEDQDGAAPAGEPFIRRTEGTVLLTANSLKLAIQRQWGEQVAIGDVRQALRDLGAEQETISWRRGGKRSTTSYYRLRLDGLVELDTEDSGNAP